MRLIMRMRLIGGGAAMAAAALACCAIAGTAQAAPRHARMMVMTRAGERAATSTFGGTAIAGYLPGNSTSTATLSTTVTIPTLNCTSQTTEPIFFNVTVLGTDANDNGANSGLTGVLSCENPDYVQLISVNTAADQTDVSPGDQIQVSVSVSPTGDTESFDDLTSGATASTSGGGFTPSNDQTTLQGGFNDGGQFPGFTYFPFAKMYVDGAPLQAGQTRFIEVGTNHKREIAPSNIAPNGSWRDILYAG